jgi:hypothetical protein
MKTLEVPDHLFDALEIVVGTFVEKGKDYATSDETWDGNFEFAEQYGLERWEGPHFDVSQKLARLAALRHRGRSAINEPVVDSYRDIAVFALIAFALLLHHNAIAHPREETTVVLRESAPYVPPVFPPGGGGGSGGMGAPGPAHGGPHG